MLRKFLLVAVAAVFLVAKESSCAMKDSQGIYKDLINQSGGDGLEEGEKE